MPRRNELASINADQTENALGVLAYLAGDLNEPEDRRNLLTSAAKASARSGSVYRLAYDRWNEAIPQQTKKIIATTGRFITGLGAASVLETGIRLHHVYGTPLIPGSGLKGLAAHYADAVWGPQNADFQQGHPIHQALFGEKSTEGMMVFHDAWILPEDLSGTGKGLVEDVMTPHHQEYNAGEDAPPSDMDSPIPLDFLSVSGRFLLAVTPIAPDPDGKWSTLTLDLLSAALKDWGAGGKTRAGYGRFR